MDRCALFVDASYALADGAMAVHGTRRRDSVSWNHAGLLTLLAGLAKDRTGLPVLRCYWYEAATEGNRTPEQEALAEMPGLKLRLVNARPGRREGIETPLRRDLVTLAKNGAICDAFIASADEHLAEIVTEVQDLGLRVVILHISADGGWTIPQPLRQECDDIVEISGVHLRPFVELIRGAEPAIADEMRAPAMIGSRGPAADSPVGALPYQGLPMAAPPAPGAMYALPDSPFPGDSIAASAASGNLLAYPGPGNPVPVDHRSPGVQPYAGLGQAGLGQAGPRQGAPGQVVRAQGMPAQAGPAYAAPGQAEAGQAGPAQAASTSAYPNGGGISSGPVIQSSEYSGQSNQQHGVVHGGLSQMGAVPASQALGYLNGAAHNGGPPQQGMSLGGYPAGAHNGASLNGPPDPAPGAAQNGAPRADYHAAIHNGMSIQSGPTSNGAPVGRDQNGAASSYHAVGAQPPGAQPPGAQFPGSQPPSALPAGSRSEGGQNGSGPYGVMATGYHGGSGEVSAYQNGTVPPGSPHAGPPQNGVYQLGPAQQSLAYQNGVPFQNGGMAQAGMSQVGPEYPGPVPPSVAPPNHAQMVGTVFPPQVQYVAQPQRAALPPARAMQPVTVSLPEAVQAAYAEGFSFGESVGRDAPGLWLDAVLARKPRMPSDLEARLLQGSALPIDSLLHDEVRHSLRRGFWDALESARR